MKILVTGGAGFIGSHLTGRLCRLGHDVRVLDDFSTGTRQNLSDLGTQIEIVADRLQGDGVASQAVNGIEVVFHLAGFTSVPASVANPAQSHESNVEASFRLLDAARQRGVRRFIFSSSSAIYGNPVNLPIGEQHPIQPVSPYGLQKWMVEQYGSMYSHLYGLEFISLRYFNVFGPRQRPDSPYAAVIPIFIRQMLRGERPTIFGDGSTTRDFCPVDNVVQANLRALEAADIQGEAFNIGSGRPTSLNQLVTRLSSSLALDQIPPRYAAERVGDIRHSLADISRARARLGFLPDVSLEDGLKKTLEWIRVRD